MNQSGWTLLLPYQRMVRTSLLAAAAVGGRRRLVDLWATAPSTVNWQQPLGQDSYPTWSPETKYQFWFVCVLVFILVCLGVYCFFCRNKKDEEHDTSRFILEVSSNNDDAEGVSAPLPPPLPEQQPPESGDGHAPHINSSEGDRPSSRRRPRRQQPPAVAEMPAADEEMALGDVQLTQAYLEWMRADVDIAPAADEEITPAPEPGPTLKCTYSTADGWAEGTCSVCLSELVDGEKVRVLTACMHCFHATCIETWLRDGNDTCPLCRALVLVRRRRRRRTQT